MKEVNVNDITSEERLLLATDIKGAEPKIPDNLKLPTASIIIFYII